MAPPAIMQVFKAFIQSLGDMGDIIDMAIKANDGKATYAVGELTNRASTGTIVSITASSTKDLYLAGATISLARNRSAVSTAGQEIFQVHLLSNTTTRETWEFTPYFVTGGGILSSTHKFNVKGVKVTTSEVISLNLAAVPVSCDVYGTIYGWQEDTGVSPQI